MQTLLLLSVLFATAEAKLVSKNLEYKDGDQVLEGYLAYDDKFRGRQPGVLIVHEWTGLGKYVKGRADQLAALGYVAFAADIYGKGIRPQPPEAGPIAGSYKNNRPLMRQRVSAGLAELNRQKQVDPQRVAAIGYCFGGTTVLELARSGADVKGTVSFHGGLDTPNPKDASAIRGSVLVLHGADDPHVPEEQVKKFEEEMRAANVDWELVKYAKAVHAFTNPEAGSDNSKGAAYNKKADERSWAAMLNFFKETLGR